jgi:hypothetical protein
MSSLNRKNSKAHNKKDSLTFKNALSDIKDQNEYEFAPQIQQYNFGSFSSRDSKEFKPTKKSSIVKEPFGSEK